MRTYTRDHVLLAAVALLVLMLMNTGTVAAQADMVGSDPVDGTTVASDLSRIVLTYGAAIDPMMTGGYVSDADGKIVSTSIKVSLDDPTQIIITLAPGLRSGWYMAMWNTAARDGDGDPVGGMLTFNVA